MESTDREILRNLLARKVGQVVTDILGREQFLDEDVDIGVCVASPTCFFDEAGNIHTGRVIIVDVDINEDGDGDDD